MTAYRTPAAPSDLSPLDRVYREAHWETTSDGRRHAYVPEGLWVELLRWCRGHYPHWYSSVWIAVDDITVWIRPAARQSP